MCVVFFQVGHKVTFWGVECRSQAEADDVVFPECKSVTVQDSRDGSILKLFFSKKRRHSNKLGERVILGRIFNSAVHTLLFDDFDTRKECMSMLMHSDVTAVNPL